ncbi:MGDG synthase family glycosyltransferase [Desmospora profundinema]|uniref:Processive 1,2-diacylglycerol beta-glucosyltransferase n=1 Tax=Desmospora profundinema TaxID=1571184 RepID=A0ABU1IRG8_9BACL|nr:glycosyltransferase [Desmospora profundinema]MDR6227383.1 processive 1,2-diacylglycerol beta-glucosyltransferase [Desmospora profundinema]
MERVIILTMGFGSGHNAAAEALREEYVLKDIPAEVIDLLELVPGSVHPLLQSGYNRMLSRFPYVYSYLYNRTNHSAWLRMVSSEIIEKTGWMIRHKLKRLIRQFGPTRVISTHPFGLLLLPSRWRTLPTVGVLTDYELHPLWLAEAPDVLCVPPNLLTREQQKWLSWEWRVQLLEAGIPCHRGFRQTILRQTAKQRLGADPNRPLVLLMGGGLGYGPLPKLAASLAGLSNEMQLWVLIGSNRKLEKQLAPFSENGDLRVFSTRNDMPLLMDAADILVTKPGGMTITEAMIKRLPLILFEALPGQERANLDYVVRRGAACAVSPDTLPDEVVRLIRDPSLRQSMSSRLESLAFPDSATRIVEHSLYRKRWNSAL